MSLTRRGERRIMIGWHASNSPAVLKTSRVKKGALTLATGTRQARTRPRSRPSRRSRPPPGLRGAPRRKWLRHAPLTTIVFSKSIAWGIPPATRRWERRIMIGWHASNSPAVLKTSRVKKGALTLATGTRQARTRPRSRPSRRSRPPPGLRGAPRRKWLRHGPLTTIVPPAGRLNPSCLPPRRGLRSIGIAGSRWPRPRCFSWQP